MADIVLFGATGYTGRLTAAALAARGASFALAGRNREKLTAVADRVGASAIHVAEVGDTQALVKALDGAKVLISTVGPFMTLGDTAVEAALEAGVHYIDSAGEGNFIDRLATRYDERAQRAGRVLAPALGFDEVPGDVIGTIASEGLERPDLTVTYSVALSGSAGTIRSALGTMGTKGPWIENGRVRAVSAGEMSRWAPLPPPLGPRETWAFPFALTRLTPRHIEVNSFRTFVATSPLQGRSLKLGRPLLRMLGKPPFGRALNLLRRILPEGPSEEARLAARWTLLAEAASGDVRRNVVATGSDVYGLTALTLSAAAITMAGEGYRGAGLLAPVPAVGLDVWRAVLDEHGVALEVYADE